MFYDLTAATPAEVLRNHANIARETAADAAKRADEFRSEASRHGDRASELRQYADALDAAAAQLESITSTITGA